MLFDIEGARERAIPPRPSYMTILSDDFRESTEALREEMNRVAYAGFQFRIPTKLRARTMPQSRCTESMFGRMHDWEITYSPARRCWACEGRLEISINDGDIESCWCTYGWIPEAWLFRCLRCGHCVSKT